MLFYIILISAQKNMHLWFNNIVVKTSARTAKVTILRHAIYDLWCKHSYPSFPCKNVRDAWKTCGRWGSIWNIHMIATLVMPIINLTDNFIIFPKMHQPKSFLPTIFVLPNLIPNSTSMILLDCLFSQFIFSF